MKNLSILNEKSIVLPLGEVNIFKKIRSNNTNCSKNEYRY